MTTQRKWIRLLAWLRQEFPLRYPVDVRSVALKGAYGETDFKRGSFIIRINMQKWFPTRVDTILHEWAHAMTWFGAGHYEDHSDEWGLAYAKIYRGWDEWDYGRSNVHRTQE